MTLNDKQVRAWTHILRTKLIPTHIKAFPWDKNLSEIEIIEKIMSGLYVKGIVDMDVHSGKWQIPNILTEDDNGSD